MSKDGILANKYSAADGIHFTGSAYKMILDYFYVHQVKPVNDSTSDFDIEDLKDIDIIVDQEQIEHILECQENKGPAIPFSTPKRTRVEI